MQRIKSQSNCQPQGHAAVSQSRPRSKKTTKPQSTQITYHLAQKNKSTNVPVTEHSMISAKSNSKILSGSMKNLRVAPHNQSISKCSVQNTSRATNNNYNNAISARILKEIVSYTQRGTAKQKGLGKQFVEGKQEPTIKIDLTEEMENLCTGTDKEEMQLRTTLSNNRNKSQEACENNQRQTRNTSSGRYKQIKNQHRIVQEFSPLNLSPQKQARRQMKKCSFFDASREQTSLINANVKQNELSKINFQTWKNYSTFNDISDENALQITNNFVKIASPHHLLSSLEKSLADKVSRLQIRGKQQKQNKKEAMNSMHKLKQDNKILDIDAKVSIQENELFGQKQRLIISLQQSNALLEQHYQFQFKQLVPYWKGIIECESKLASLENDLKELSSKLSQQKQHDFIKKTELFELARDQICRKKQKDFITRSSKDKCLQQAIACQQALKLKLSSKADYEHVVLFNEKVVLTGRNSTDDLYQLFTEMFQSKIAKKFALIAKKQLANLSVYDSRLIQDFLKRIQQLQLLYHKSEAHSTSQASHHYCSNDEQLKLETLVQQIQQFTLQLQFVTHTIAEKQKQKTEIERRLKQLDFIIEEEIASMNRKVSGQYKMTEGYSFDFETLLSEKYTKQFENYRREIVYRDEIVAKIRQLQKAMTKKESHALPQSNLTSRSVLSSRTKEDKRKSISILETPNRSPLRIYQNEQKMTNK